MILPLAGATEPACWRPPREIWRGTRSSPVISDAKQSHQSLVSSDKLAAATGGKVTRSAGLSFHAKDLGELHLS
jgi:hypothetical protein